MEKLGLRNYSVAILRKEIWDNPDFNGKWDEDMTWEEQADLIRRRVKPIGVWPEAHVVIFLDDGTYKVVGLDHLVAMLYGELEGDYMKYVREWFPFYFEQEVMSGESGIGEVP